MIEFRPLAEADLPLLRTWLERHDVYPRGRYGFWTYNSMEDCILAGREVAATIEAKLAA